MKKLDNIISKILIIFLLIQPIFDIKPFYNSISTLIRVIIIFIIFMYYFLTSKNKHKYLLIIYPCLIGIYFIFHHINALNFKSLVPGNFGYSILEEGLYFVKMLSPFLLIYSLYKAKFSNETIMNIIKTLVLIISIIIVFSNLFVFSYGSYSDTTIKANFFEWFNSNSSYVYQDLASKGLFEYANQISAILIMFLPFVFFSAINEKKNITWITLFFNIFALILLCTKVSVLGIFVVLIYTAFAYCFISFIRKQKINVKQYIPIGITLLLCCLLLPVNPMFSRIQERETVAEAYNSQVEIEKDKNTLAQEIPIIDNTSNEQTTTDSSNVQSTIKPTPSETTIRDNTQTNQSNREQMIEYILQNYESKQMHIQFIFDNYPYEYDPEFWYNFLQNDIWKLTDYRFIEISMIKRVVEINNNPLDKYLGITNIRLQNIFNIERDFVVQYYALGIIGLILVFAPYFAILAYFAYKVIHSKFKEFNVINLLASITVVFVFCISYFTGNLLNSLSFTIYFTLCFLLLENK